MKKKALAVAVATALTAPMAAQAVSTNWYGHLNRAIQFVDDGNNTDINFIDVTSYSSRMGWTGTADAGNGLTVGGKAEFDFRSNTVYGQGINAVDAGEAGFRLRHADIWFSGNFGKLSLGQGGDATDGVAYATHNSAWEGSELSHDWGISAFRDGNGNSSGLTAYSFSTSFDGGRRDRIRYDTPSFGPVTAHISAGTNSRVDASVRLSSDMGGGSLLARIGYAHAGGAAGVTAGANHIETVSGSLSYKFSQGTHIDFMYGERDGAGNPDPNTFYVGLGHAWGNNSVIVDYMEGNDVTAGCTGDRIGVGMAHNLPSGAATLYAGYHNYGADCTAAVLAGLGTGALEDISEFHVGARVHFD